MLVCAPRPQQKPFCCLKICLVIVCHHQRPCYLCANHTETIRRSTSNRRRRGRGAAKHCDAQTHANDDDNVSGVAEMMLKTCSFELMKMNSWGSNRACCHAVIWLVCVITFTVIHLKDSCLASCQACGAIQGNVRSQVTRIHSLSYKYVGSSVSLSDVSFIYFKRKCTFNVIMRLFSWWKRNVSFLFSRLKFQRLYLSNAMLHGSEIELCSRCRSVTNSGTLGNVTLEEFWSQKVTPQNSGLYPAQRFSAIISIHLAYVISYSNVFTPSLKLFVTVLGLNCLLTGMKRGGFIISNTH